MKLIVHVRAPSISVQDTGGNQGNKETLRKAMRYPLHLSKHGDDVYASTVSEYALPAVAFAKVKTHVELVTAA